MSSPKSNPYLMIASAIIVIVIAVSLSLAGWNLKSGF